MSGFWADKVAPQQAPAASQQPQQGPWWQRSIMPYQQGQQPPQQPVVPVQQYAQPQPQGVPIDPNQEYNFGDLLRQSNYTTTKAQSAKVDSHCPGCGGDNYLKPPGTQAMPQCYECGYNPRFEQQAAGMGNVPTVGPIHQARAQGKTPVDAPKMGSVIGKA